MTQSERRDIAGLTCADWNAGADGPTVLALHGLTNTSEVWRALAEALPGTRVIAPDLPGRGGSVTTKAAPGLAGHAAEVVRVAGECALDDVVLVGHSMGGYLAPLVAAKLGDRVRKLVLLDGGVLPEPRWTLRRPVVRAQWKLIVRPLGRAFPDAGAFVDQVEGRAIARRPDLRPHLLRWAAHLMDGAGRPRVDQARLIDDAVDTLTGAPTLPLLAALDVPVHVILAEHDGDDSTRPFITDRGLEAGRTQLPRLTAERIPANHVTMLFDEAAPRAVHN
ncbi:alpha/beta fold hydrolase [Paractinoplanes hotanensis]|uniref:Alpha/beta hydrolase n=1 Tax=Paractinoplanes hotanensis TaxID=2906497 RepID=A0ABT0XYE0_9ACTN|nr:alpha/beta hydrolase [Actinoplanes hotanensis]MCM4078791.1 alpha/beta hydrolase [Actinoplanes hotanensis]